MAGRRMSLPLTVPLLLDIQGTETDSEPANLHPGSRPLRAFDAARRRPFYRDRRRMRASQFLFGFLIPSIPHAKLAR